MIFPRLGAMHRSVATWDLEALGAQWLAYTDTVVEPASATWPTANKALYIPFALSEPATVTRCWVVNGGTASGNLDIGVYDADGVLLVSSGATAQAGTSAIQAVNVTDTLLGRGLFFLGLSHSSAAGTYARITTPSVTASRAAGVLEQTSAHPLPAVAAFVAVSTTYLPLCGLTLAPVTVP
jgi:hypothetical protein